MTYKEILADFKKLLESCLTLDCISDKVIVSSVGTDGEITLSYIDNQAKNLMDDWIHEMDVIYETIFNSLNALFIDTDDEYLTPDLNYQMINGYADGSRTLEYYNSTEETFTEMPEYWYTRGNLYDMLPKANEGLYVYKFLQNIKNVVSLCKEYESLYSKYPNPPSSSDEEGNTIPVSKAEVFWNEYFLEFEEKVNGELSILLSEKNKFYSLIQFIRDYKKVYEDVSTWLSKGENFVSALKKTSVQSGESLGDSYSRVGVEGFSLYSSSLGFIYSLFLKAKQERDSSHYSTEDDSDLYLRKIMNNEILIYFNYFERAKSCLSWILEFRNHYDI